ncbi:hypothetical protein [Halarcobacter bivalviorum]|uniref:Uncharacterized protein n=1 Tax=Halarcobacter bivalviorum TaxID=663364 RepID=A0AAX2AB02_9BACT|nr:hypothetical protein [Halarcobacter bivalviorum]AXH11674.1 hypothetical protein ABIV_0661 [Halarcobacter bivalviorum]RXK10807.1 hypothetical protein CRV05_00090 [Halarcobacter bivalviorum]
MSEIKKELYELVTNTMIPEVENYIEDLHKLIENNEQTDETLEEVRDMESFLVELQNILLAIDENKIEDEQAKEILEKINKMIEEHSEH